MRKTRLVSDAPIDPLVWLLERYEPRTALEAKEVDRVRAIAAGGSAWGRAAPVHVTGSALVVHPPTGRVLLRWHERQQAWLQVGGHADPGETHPLDVALREGHEETSLRDLATWTDAAMRHVVVVPVAAGRGEPEHEHVDLRFLLATATPDDVRPEKPTAALQWLTVAEASARTTESNLREFIARAGELFPLR